jgi:hypothetical protein
MLTFIAETREYVWGELRNGDRPTGKQIGDHLRNVRAALPPGVKQIYGRADSGLYCRETVEAYEEFNARFVICVRKTPRLIEELRQAKWKPSPKTDADAECEFHYQPDGWSKPYRFVALRQEKPREELEAEQTEQYQLGSAHEYEETGISGCFRESDKFSSGHGHALRLQQEVVQVFVAAPTSEQSFDIAVHRFQDAHRHFGTAIVEDPIQMIR